MPNFDVEMTGVVPLRWQVTEELDGRIHVFLGLADEDTLLDVDPMENPGNTISMSPELLADLQDDDLWRAFNSQAVQIINEGVLPAFLIPLNIALKEMRERLRERESAQLPPEPPFDQDAPES